MHTEHAHAPSITLGPRTASFLVACASVVTAHLLAVDWLAEQVLLLPAGLWLVLLATLAAHLYLTRGSWRHATPELNLPRSVAAPLDKASRKLNSLKEQSEFFAALSDAITTSTDTSRPAHRRPSALRIALDLPHDEQHHLLNALHAEQNATGLTTNATPITPAVRAAHPNRCPRGFDACIARSTLGPLVITTRTPTTETDWADWAHPRPLSYANLFPSRLDPRQVTLQDLAATDRAQAELIAATAVAAAAAARHAAGAHGPAPDYATTAFLRLCTRLQPFTDLPTPPASTAAPARAAAAFLTTWEGELPDTTRAALIADITKLTHDEPAAALRRGAAMIAAQDDNNALATFLEAQTTITQARTPLAADPHAFIQAEVELGSSHPLTLGRVAAALTLLWATTPPEQLDYLKEDVFDDLRYAGWLIGKDPDLLLLKQLTRALAHARLGPDAIKPNEQHEHNADHDQVAA